MDRREALKKLAVGGATAAGLTAVMTSTAFANGGTINSIPPGSPLQSATATRLGGTVTCTLGISPPTCPFGTPTTARVDSAFALTPIGAATASPAENTWVASRNPLAVTVTGLPGDGDNLSIVIRFDFRSVCDSRPNGATAAWRCQSFDVTIATGGGGASSNVIILVTTAVASAPGSCDSPAPSPS
jgi:hypothetical protein